LVVSATGRLDAQATRSAFEFGAGTMRSRVPSNKRRAHMVQDRAPLLRDVHRHGVDNFNFPCACAQDRPSAADLDQCCVVVWRRARASMEHADNNERTCTTVGVAPAGSTTVSSRQRRCQQQTSRSRTRCEANSSPHTLSSRERPQTNVAHHAVIGSST